VSARAVVRTVSCTALPPGGHSAPAGSPCPAPGPCGPPRRPPRGLCPGATILGPKASWGPISRGPSAPGPRFLAPSVWRPSSFAGPQGPQGRPLVRSGSLLVRRGEGGPALPAPPRLQARGTETGPNTSDWSAPSAEVRSKGTVHLHWHAAATPGHLRSTGTFPSSKHKLYPLLTSNAHFPRMPGMAPQCYRCALTLE
jgi:hypothetical protein